MLAAESLKDLLSQPGYSRRDKLLLCMAVSAASPKAVAEIRELAVGAGATEAKKWNVAEILRRAKGYAVRTKNGWELTSQGRRLVGELSGPFTAAASPRVAGGLRSHLASISVADTREFVEEAVKAFESRLYRAAVVLSWVGAVALLQDHVVSKRLADFNTEATRRDAKWKPAKSRDDLARMKESAFLNIIETLSIIGKSVKHELEVCLKLRNGCGHPNSLKVGEAKTAAHLETLVQNVFAQFL